MQDEGKTNQLPPSPSTPPISNWSFNAGGEEGSIQPVSQVDGVEWSASEFIAHDKSSMWYVSVVLATILTAGVSYLMSREIITPVLIAITGVLFAIMGARKPRELRYAVDEKGIYVDQKFYSYSGFKSFSIVQEGAIESIWFMPLRRFTPSLTIYFAPDDGSRIVETLSQFLPVEGRQLDPIDRLMHRIGF